jgi:hypothetical protein
MFSKAMVVLSAAMILGAASTLPAFSKNVRVRVASPVRSYIPAPAYGLRLDGRAHSPNPAHDVYVSGKYSGSDPDPFIRSQLAHDPPWNRTR